MLPGVLPWTLKLSLSRQRYLLLVIAIILSSGTYYYFGNRATDAKTSTDNSNVASMNDPSNLTSYLNRFKHLLWLPDTIPDKYVFGTYDHLGRSVTFSHLVIYQMVNSSNGDYIEFVGENDLRAVYGLQTIPKHMFGRGLWMPANKREFLRKWDSGQFLNCVGMKIKSTRVTPEIGESYVDNMARFRDFIESYQSTPFLFGGTLLGWYRECSFIKDTTDVDFAMKIASLNTTMLQDAAKSDDFTLYWILGKINDSLELSVYSANIKMDLFFLYEEKDFAWVGGMIVGERKKLRWIYPPIPQLCTGDLLGRLFHVPCNVEEVLEEEHGNWMKPYPTDRFVWYESHKNIHSNGYWSKNEWNDVYRVFSEEP